MIFHTDHEQKAWDLAMTLDEFNSAELVRRGIGKGAAMRYLRRWRLLKRIRLARIDQQNRKFYVAIDAKVKPSVELVSGVPTREGNMWRAMRRLSQFTPVDVAAHANAGSVNVTVEQARGYCRRLFAAEYLQLRKKAQPGEHEAIYQLVSDTGPRPPEHKRFTGIYDPNIKKFIPVNKDISL